MTSDVTGSSICSRAIHCRAPISACPVFSRTSDTCTVLIPFATRPAQPMYWRFTPAVAAPVFSCPVSSIAAITRPPRRRPRRAAASSPAAANRRTSLIAAAASHDARFSSRCIRSGDRSPACSAVVHPFRFGSSLASAETYFAACSHVCVRAKQPRSAPTSSARFRTASPAPILAAAAASDSSVLTST
jgi:hypothetical protein